jgi:hypothetical protein
MYFVVIEIKMYVSIEKGRNNLQPSDIFRMIIGNTENCQKCTNEIKQLCAEIYSDTNDYSISMNVYTWKINSENLNLKNYLNEKLILNYSLGNIGHFDII